MSTAHLRPIPTDPGELLRYRCIATWRTQMPDFHGFFGLAAREGHHV